jgi:glycosyltransferase involved in cell wall biosynthesis
MIFIRRVDPLIPSWFDYPLPSRIGNTITTQVSSDGPLPRQDYLGLFNQANIFIAPRLSEGVGLTFIEALARGCAVFAYNAPTMNEYISSGMNGYLLPRYGSSLLRFLGERVRSRLLRYRAEWMTREPFFEHRVSEWQDWEAIGKLDLVTLGNSAREGQAIGFAKWRESIPDLARFILDW